jgi:malate synthase
MNAPAAVAARIAVDPILSRFIDEEVLPGLEMDAAAFWRGVDEIFRDFAPRNAALLAKRDELQTASTTGIVKTAASR